jgi:hypothetical protein
MGENVLMGVYMFNCSLDILHFKPKRSCRLRMLWDVLFMVLSCTYGVECMRSYCSVRCIGTFILKSFVLHTNYIVLFSLVYTSENKGEDVFIHQLNFISNVFWLYL